YWHALTTTDLAGGALANAVAVLPAGAIEQHGPHLPLGTDLLIARALAERAAALAPGDIDLLLLPETAISYSTEHRGFAGTLSLRPETLIAAWCETGAAVARAGVRRLAIVNAHGGNVPAMDIAARELRADHGMRVAALSWFDFGLPEGAIDAADAAHDIHGGFIETSMMRYLNPELVHMERAADFASATRDMVRDAPALFVRGVGGFGWLGEDLNPQGVAGNAAAADAETGRRLVDHAAAGFAAVFADLARLALPG
ncbi:MAG: creatininase family protein, partial [Alphaproteobacteria bacterium]